MLPVYIAPLHAKSTLLKGGETPARKQICISSDHVHKNRHSVKFNGAIERAGSDTSRSLTYIPSAGCEPVAQVWRHKRDPDSTTVRARGSAEGTPAVTPGMPHSFYLFIIMPVSDREKA